MQIADVQQLLSMGENIAVEFKRAGNGISSDTYETVCSFLNRFGGDIFLGVLDDGSVEGVPEKAAPDMVKNFIKNISNDNFLSPTIYLAPEILHYDDNHTIIHIHIPPSAEVHSYKRVIYDRVDDADVKVTATSAIAQMYIRKQGIFTERKVYPYARMDDLRTDLFPKIRTLAVNHAGGDHPWQAMTDIELLKSAGLYGRDMVTGKEGFNLAAIMLLGKDDTILSVAPAYVTDALVRRVNVDRYDDREIIKTNLVDSYEQLMAFGKKHLPDKFYLEDTANKSLRNIILREMIANTLIHREFSSAYTAKFVIESGKMYTENANRAKQYGMLTTKNMEPHPKNPLIAAFFRNIGYADQLGSGVRNLYKYSRFYSGLDPQFSEGDVFVTTVAFDDAVIRDAFAGDAKADDRKNEANLMLNEANGEADKWMNDALAIRLKALDDALAVEIFYMLQQNHTLTQKMICEKTGKSRSTVQRSMKQLQDKKLIWREGSRRNSQWNLAKE